MTILWVVGKFRVETIEGRVWDLIAICESEYLAIMACKDHFDYFVGPLQLNNVLSDELTEWPGCYYPYES